MHRTDAISLALEFSGRTASLAVIRPEKTTQVLSEGRNHLEQAIELIDRILKESGSALSDLSGVIVPSGPGSFTGLRVGLATAKGLCLKLQVPLYTVSASEARALSWLEKNGNSTASRIEVYTPASSSRATRTVFDVKSRERLDEGVVDVKDVGTASPDVVRLVEESLQIEGGISIPLRAEMLGICFTQAKTLKKYADDATRALVDAEYFGTRF